jgi:hypothetical protein
LPDRLRPYAVVAAVLAALALALVWRGCGDDAPGPTVAIPGAPQAEPFPDPFAWDEDREDELVARAAAGLAHGLYVFSPGGIEASAERTARHRAGVEAAAQEADVDPDRLEGLVLLESAGRDDALTAAGIEGAAGVAQIVAGTATALLDMQVDLERSRRLTRRIDRALRAGDPGGRVERLRAQRRAVDERFDPAKALPAAGRYLRFARDRLEREDLAFVSYHMGVGNLEGVLDAFGEEDPSWAQVYFDSTPTRHAEAYARLRALSDDSANYLWKVEAAMEAMRLYREDREELRRLAGLQTLKNSAEEVLHPLGTTPVFEDRTSLEEAYARGEVVELPEVEGIAIDKRMGELAARVEAPASLYRGLRPEALALALYISAQVREIAPGTALKLTSTVRDRRYQEVLLSRNSEATRNYSLHTTGWAFDVGRDYRDREHALAFQFVLDRLQALNLIAWVREPRAIHITASRDAEQLLGLLERATP